MCKETLSIYFSIRRYTLKSVRQVKRIINTQPQLLPYKSVHFSFGLVIEEHGVDQSFFFNRHFYPIPSSALLKFPLFGLLVLFLLSHVHIFIYSRAEKLESLLSFSFPSIILMMAGQRRKNASAAVILSHDTAYNVYLHKDIVYTDRLNSTCSKRYYVRNPEPCMHIAFFLLDDRKKNKRVITPLGRPIDWLAVAWYSRCLSSFTRSI